MGVSNTSVAVVAGLLLASLGSVEAGNASTGSSIATCNKAFIGCHNHDARQRHDFQQSLSVRGGAKRVYDEEDEYDSDVDEYDSETEEEEEQRVAKLSKSARKAATKVKTKKAAVTEKAVSASLSQSKPKKQKTSLLKALHVPYIIRACLNPFTFLAMTKAYFASLFNIDYLVEDSSQTLRSALEDKAKKSGSAGGKKRKRQFKPGQAKTLSDLPQLSA